MTTKLLKRSSISASGRIVFRDTPLTDSSPTEHRKAGIEMVHQELALAKNHDVAANLFAGRDLTRWVLLNRAAMKARAKEMLSELQIDIPRFDVAVGKLSGGQQQAVAIARALLLFDPPVCCSMSQLPPWPPARCSTYFKY